MLGARSKFNNDKERRNKILHALINIILSIPNLIIVLFVIFFFIYDSIVGQVIPENFSQVFGFSKYNFGINLIFWGSGILTTVFLINNVIPQ